MTTCRSAPASERGSSVLASMPGRLSISLRQRTAFFTMTGIAEFLPLDTANGHSRVLCVPMYTFIPRREQRSCENGAEPSEPGLITRQRLFVRRGRIHDVQLGCCGRS